MAKYLPCTALYLYGARCGMVHTLTAESDLSDKGKARRILYASGTGKASILQKVSDREKKTHEMVAVQLEDLFEALDIGLMAFVKELKSDPPRAVSVHQRAGKFFATLLLDKEGNVTQK